MEASARELPHRRNPTPNASEQSRTASEHATKGNETARNTHREPKVVPTPLLIVVGCGRGRCRRCCDAGLQCGAQGAVVETQQRASVRAHAGSRALGRARALALALAKPRSRAHGFGVGVEDDVRHVHLRQRQCRVLPSRQHNGRLAPRRGVVVVRVRAAGRRRRDAGGAVAVDHAPGRAPQRVAQAW